MNMHSMSIRTRLIMGFIGIIIIFLITVLTSIIIIQKTYSNADQVIKVEFRLFDKLVDLNNTVYITYSNLQSYLLTSDTKYKDITVSSWDKISSTRDHIDDLIKKSTNRDIILLWENIKSELIQLKAIELQIINSTDKQQQHNLMTSKLMPFINNLLDQLIIIGDMPGTSQGILDLQLNGLTIDSKNILTDMSFLSNFEYIMLFISVIASIIIALFTSKKIVPPIKNAIDVAKKIAAGDRDVDITIASQDEPGQLLTALKLMQKSIRDSESNLLTSEKNTREMFEDIVQSAKKFSLHAGKVASGDLRQHIDAVSDKGNIMYQLGNDLNKMTSNLSSITKEITQACHTMVSTVEQVSHAIDLQSSGASEQATSINEITASLTEIEKSSTQTIEKAKSLGDSAEKTREKGQLGLEAIDQSVTGMKSVRDKVQLIAQTILDLSNKTQQVGEITSAVNNLAQQSKMLALNASIEAAKAGEAGKGFAVVAVEVKNLAEQSEQATTQVQKILEDIRQAAEKAVMVTEEGTKGVDEGTGLVEQTGDIIRSLNEVIHETTIASQQIQSAVRQESAGIEQITAGMSEINQVTATFVESVRQTTAAISNLSDIAKGLKSFIDTYKI